MRTLLLLPALFTCFSSFAHVSEWEDDLNYRVEESPVEYKRKVASEEFEASEEKIDVDMAEGKDREIASSLEKNKTQYWNYEGEADSREEPE